MTPVRQLWRAGETAILAGVVWLAVRSAALAQVGGKPETIPGQGFNSMTYVWSYALVILGVGLGMLFVCRSSNRRERARPEQYESKTIKAEEE